MIENARISVQGKGAIHVVPDVMRIEVKVQSVFPDYQHAYAQAKENFGWMVKILEYNKKQSNLAKTIRFDITDHLVPEYNNAGKQIGYEKDGFDLEQCIKVDLPVDNVLANKFPTHRSMWATPCRTRARVSSKCSCAQFPTPKKKPSLWWKLRDAPSARL